MCMTYNRSLVCGHGVNDCVGSISVGGKLIKSYEAWKSMLQRCYSPTFLERNPAYRGCVVADEFLRYSSFDSWFQSHYRHGYSLDKDILFPGNKTYGPDVCCYVPKRINSLVLSTRCMSRDLPVGVRLSQTPGLYIATLGCNGRTLYIGTYSTPDDAFDAYVTAKKVDIKRVAQEAFLANEINSDVYLALVRREIVPFPS